MASSSSCKTQQEEEDNSTYFKVEEKEWLQLGLGLGFGSGKLNPPSASSLPLHQPQPQVGSGLELGFGNEGVGVAPPPPPQRLWREHHGLPSPSPSPSPSSFMLFKSPSYSYPTDTGSTTINLGLPPLKSHSGLWFILRPLINRDGEMLPQIAKAYIRVKDENVTVFMVKTYLVRKLGLSHDTHHHHHQVDIWCMGQKLLHSQTLKHVRDSIWVPAWMESVNSRATWTKDSDGISVKHLMSLEYGR